MTAEEVLQSAHHRDELTPGARLRLYETLDTLQALVAEINRGAGFSEDRGFGWGFAQEQQLGSNQLFELLRDWPLLRRLLPSLRHFRHEAQPVIANCREAADEIRIARSVLMQRTDFRTQHGTGWGEMILTVRFDDDALVVAEQTVADATSGQTLSSGESRVSYSEFSGFSGVGVKVREHFPDSVFGEIAALAGRYCKAILPCDVCGTRVHQFSLPGDGLHIEHWSCWGHDETTAITPAVRVELRRALLEQDGAVLRRLNAEWATGLIPAENTFYCQRHWPQEEQVN